MPDDVEADRRVVALLRDRTTEPQQLQSAFMEAGVDLRDVFALVAACIGDEAVVQFSGRALRRRSPDVETAIEKAADVKRIIDGIRLREGDLRTATLAERLNELGVPAPRGGAWRGEQVYRVLKRSGEGQRRRSKNRPQPGVAPLEKQTHEGGRAERRNRRHSDPG